MKKQLLWGALLLGSFFTAQAQGDSCADAEVLTPGDAYTASSWPGAAASDCWGSTTSTGAVLNGAWYSYTPTTNGYLTLTSAVASNPTTGNSAIDTRLSVYTGACDALLCYYATDDVSATDYRSAATFPVAAGTTYYVVWDNYWQALEFDFDVTFEAVDCVYPNELTFETSNLSTTGVTVSWDAAAGNPAGYQVLYGTTGFDPETAGTLLDTATNSATIADQAVGTELDYYVRSVCGANSSSDWIGPFYVALATTLPLEESFDDTNNPAGGFSSAGFSYIVNTAQQSYAESPTGSLYSATSTTSGVPTNKWIFVRPIYLQYNQAVTVDFYANYISNAAGSVGSFEVTIGTDTSTNIANHTIIDSYTLASSGVFGQYNQFTTEPYTAGSTGIYYIAIRNTTPAIAAASVGYLFVDTFSITAELGTETLTANKLSVYPNPTTDIVNIANAGLINNVKVTDLNGRTVKAAAFDGVDAAQVSIADLASGVYMMTVASDKGTTTTKIVKN